MAHEASFREAFDDFIEDKLYQSNVANFQRDTGLTPLEDLHLQTIRRWLLDHKDLSPNTLATYDRCLRVVCNWLERRGYLAESPMRQLPKRQPKRTTVETYTREDLHAVLDRCRRSRSMRASWWRAPCAGERRTGVWRRSARRGLSTFRGVRRIGRSYPATDPRSVTATTVPRRRVRAPLSR